MDASPPATEPIGPTASTASTMWPTAAPPVEAEWPLIGRDEILAELVGDLAAGRRRAIALTGLGGVGKTRLAAEVARAVAPTLGGRVAWIPLVAASRERGLLETVAAGIGSADLEPDHPTESLIEAVGADPVLLVLDRAEGFPGIVRPLEDLLATADHVRLLITSRLPIGSPSVHEIAVNTLDVPHDGDDAAAVEGTSAVALLVDRASRAGAEVAVTERTAPALARLVRGLDGLPLAIELAAPLLRVLPPHRLLERIGEHLDPLAAAIGWSHDQLPDDAQRLYRRLSVFSGAFSRADVYAFAERCVAHGLSPLGPDHDRDLDRLIAAGLVRQHRHGPAPDEVGRGEDHQARRDLVLPSLIREDALHRLSVAGGDTAAHWAWAMCLLDLAEAADTTLVIQDRVRLFRSIDEVHDDLVAALERARVVGEGAFMLRLTGALAEYWRSRGQLAEGRIWLDTALRMGPNEPTADRARALHGAGMLANWQSDFQRARTMLEEALAIRLTIGELGDAAATLNQLGLIELDLGNLGEAERHCRQGLDIRRSLGDDAAIAGSLNTLGGVLQFSGRTEEAGTLFEESLAIRRRLGDEAGASVSLGNLGLVARDRGDLDVAADMFREAIATRQRLGDRQRVAVVRHNLALVLFDLGELDAARTELEAALETARELGDRLETSNALSDLGFVEAAAGNGDRAGSLQLEALAVAARIEAKGIVAQSIDGVAGLVAAAGRPEAAATLWAAAETIRRDAHYHLLQADRRRIDREIATAREALDEAAWWRSWAEGEGLTTTDAIERARAALGADAVTARAARQVAV